MYWKTQIDWYIVRVESELKKGNIQEGKRTHIKQNITRDKNYCKNYYKQNKEKLRVYYENYYKNHKEQYKNYYTKSKLKKEITNK